MYACPKRMHRLGINWRRIVKIVVTPVVTSTSIILAAPIKSRMENVSVEDCTYFASYNNF